QHRTLHAPQSVALQRTEIIDVSQFAAQLLKNYPVSVASDDPVRLFQVLFKMSLHAIVVDERVVNVEQEDDVRHFDRDSPDESQTGINVRVFPALLQDRREVLTATCTSGNPNACSRV